MSWMDILKFDSRTDKEIIKELSDLLDLMGKYLDIDNGLYGPDKSIAILFKNAKETIEDSYKYPDEEYSYNFKFIDRLTDETSAAMFEASEEGDEKKEEHFRLIEESLNDIYKVMQMREKLNRDID